VLAGCRSVLISTRVVSKVPEPCFSDVFVFFDDIHLLLRARSHRRDFPEGQLF
jgi:hypothetical protein